MDSGSARFSPGRTSESRWRDGPSVGRETPNELETERSLRSLSDRRRTAAGGQNTTRFRPIRKDGSGVSPVIATILMVAITVVLASVLYTSVGGTMVGPSGGHSCLGPQVQIQATESGWLVEILTVAPGTRPAGMFVEVRAPDGTRSLAKTSLSGLGPETGAVYRDANPSVDDVRPGDGIALDDARFLGGSTIAISDGTGMVTVRTLR